MDDEKIKQNFLSFCFETFLYSNQTTYKNVQEEELSENKVDIGEGQELSSSLYVLKLDGA